VWNPDGRGSRAKIGVLTPHLDPVPESEFTTLAPVGVSIHAARVPLGMIGTDGLIVPSVGPDEARAFSEPPQVDDAVSSLMPLVPNTIVYAFTSSSYILGADADLRLKQRLEQRAANTPIVVQTQALVAAITTLGAERVDLIHPPWYTPELDQLGANYFSAQGIEVVHHGPAELRNDYGDIEPEQIYNWVKDHVSDSADLVVIGGSGFRAIGAIAALESALSRPVISANQAAFWLALRKAGLEDDLPEYGQLFQSSV
jgi:maleate isomerase